MGGSIKKNYLYNTGYQLLIMLLPLVTTPYVSRVLRPEGVGQNSYVMAVSSYFVLFAALGTVTYGQREISYLQTDRKKRSQVFWEIEGLCISATVICFLAYILFCQSREADRYLFYIYGLQILTVAVDISWLFMGMEDFKTTVTRNVVIRLVGVALIFLLVKSETDVGLYALISTGSTFLGGIFLWTMLPKYVDRPRGLNSPFCHLKGTISLFIPSIAIQLYLQMDKVMLGAIVGSEAENGYYEQSIKLVKLVLSLVTALGTVMIPRIGSLLAKQDRTELERLINRNFNFVWFISVPMCFGMMGCVDSAVPWFFGPGYEKVSILVKILCVQLVLIGLSNIMAYQILVPTRRQNIFTATVCGGALVNLLLNFLLIPRLTSVGAALASVAAEFTVTASELYILRNEISISKILRMSRNYLLAGGVMLVGLLTASSYLEATFLNTVLLVCGGGMIYGGVLLLVRDQFVLNELMPIALKILKRIKGKTP